MAELVRRTHGSVATWKEPVIKLLRTGSNPVLTSNECIMNQQTCPHCGEKENFHFNYDYTKKEIPVLNVLCNHCGEFFGQEKEIQKQLIIEIMNSDAKDGLYDTDGEEQNVGALDWLRNKLHEECGISIPDEVFDQAKSIEKEHSIGLIKQTAMFMSAATLDKDIAAMSFDDVYNSYYKKN